MHGTMADRNEKLLAELLKRPGNSECAECGSKNTEWSSYNIGIFVCTRCAGIHRSLGAHISKVKHLKLDRWEDSQVEHMKEVGNIKAKLKYEERVPPCYRRPVECDPQQEFCHPERQEYVSGYKEGFLMKRGKEDSKYHPRKFILSEADDLNVAFAPEKLDNQNSFQITFIKDGLTRHIYVMHNDAEVIVNWYMAIRCVKLHRLQVAYPSVSETEDPHPKGEIFLGYMTDGYSVRVGVPQGAKELDFCFTLHTPNRSYLLSATTDEERDDCSSAGEQEACIEWYVYKIASADHLTADSIL
ncbi:hypothetical protein B566_EDAN009103 [Ephemera danica]|nr:hypothetical protein B566_EDAN009103 [Ephemera danica]